MLNNKKVIVGMSGGVDSSVAAALLNDKGFEVIGLTITPFKIDNQCRTLENERSCCSYQSVLDANDVCKQLGIEHILIDLTEIFREKVVNNFINEYLSGRTPNPCVICNHTIKWYAMLKKADEYNAKFVATGHYSNVIQTYNGNYIIRRGKDSSKDQSYFLWMLSQEQLSRTIFPLALLDKKQTRELANKFNLPVKDKIESQEICFIPKNDYRQFLSEQVPDLDEKIGKGDIIFNNNVIGTHKGFPYYTIGQRKGLGISYDEPLYIKSITAEKNIIEVATIKEIQKKGLISENFNIFSPELLDANIGLTAKIRYRDIDEPVKCEIKDNKLIVHFEKPKKAITPGQSVVIYYDDFLVAGGIISNSF